MKRIVEIVQSFQISELFYWMPVEWNPFDWFSLAFYKFSWQVIRRDLAMSRFVVSYSIFYWYRGNLYPHSCSKYINDNWPCIIPSALECTKTLYLLYPNIYFYWSRKIFLTNRTKKKKTFAVLQFCRFFSSLCSQKDEEKT